jgi:sugar phosphate isomerase/epimerase
MIQIGLNPYGLTYYLGLQGRGTPRANPGGRGLAGFVEIAEEIGAKTIEIHNAWLTAMGPSELRCLRERFEARGMTPVISLGPPLEGVDTAIRSALATGAKVIRLGLTPVLCGARAEYAAWPDLVQHVRITLRHFAPVAYGSGLTLAIEDHQDFGSQELLDFCAEAGPGVGICFDVGNALAVAEDPLAFARRAAPLVRHVHLKDYTPQWTDDGYRLVRCAIGDGAMPFREVFEILNGQNEILTASLEPGALEARHIRLFRPEWWKGYPPKAASELGPCLAAARRNRLDENAEWRTPWERGAPPREIIQYELDMVRRSAANMRAIGPM